MDRLQERKVLVDRLRQLVDMILGNIGIDGEEVRLGDRVHVLRLAGIGACLDGVGHPEVPPAIHLLGLFLGHVKDGELAGIRRHQLGDRTGGRSGAEPGAHRLAVGHRVRAGTETGIERRVILLDINTQALQQNPVGADRAGAFPAHGHDGARLHAHCRNHAFF